MDKSQCIAKVMAEACRSVPELDIPEAEPVDVRVQKLTIRVWAHAKNWQRSSWN